MRLHAYVVARDFGFAPNPFHGHCTLATCKPRIRKSAAVGDWVVGTGSASKGRRDHVVYAMKVAEAMSFDSYWSDHRFLPKRPNLFGSRKQAYGDNIYHRNPATGGWIQENSHHTLPDGSPNPKNVRTDTSVDRVLVAIDFVYWGRSGPVLPARFRNPDGLSLCLGRQGQKSSYPPDFIAGFVAWLATQGVEGFAGEPLDW